MIFSNESSNTNIEFLITLQYIQRATKGVALCLRSNRLLWHSSNNPKLYDSQLLYDVYSTCSIYE